MKKSDKLKRAVAFYFSVALFFILLPILLSYALGYKIDYKKFKIYKTGILYINSNPSGASVYINGQKNKDLTPAQVEELKPGTYKIEVTRQGFYPWEKEMAVRPNMVTKADRIILFPITQELTKVNNYPISDFAVSDKNEIYYFTDYGLFKSNMDGTGLQRLSVYSKWPKKMFRKKFAPDGNKVLCFDRSAVYVVYLNRGKTLSRDGETTSVEEVMSSEELIDDIFWHSGSGYITVVTEKDVKVAELLGGGKRNIVSLYKFNKRPSYTYYDDGSDSLYFPDESSGPKSRNYLYRLDLRQKFFESFMNMLLLKKETDPQDEK